MHHDIFRLNPADTLARDFRLPSAPRDYVWSKYIWATLLDEWIALFRPPNLALVYMHRQFLEKGWSNDNAALINQFIQEKYLIPVHEGGEQVELDHLIKSARAGTYRFICILPTTKCPLRCAYCHQKTAPEDSRTMTPDELNRGLAKCAALCADSAGPIDILIYGGEPLSAFSLTQQMLKLTEPDTSLFKQPVRVTLTTSGYSLQEWQADLLARRGVFVILSIDGLSASNDPIRSLGAAKSSFVVAERAYHLLRERGCRTGLSVTIGTHNFNEFSQQLEELLKHFQPTDIGLNAFLHRIGEQSNPFQLDSEQAFETFIAGFKLTREYGIYAEQPFRRLKPFAFRKPLVKDCSSPGERLVLVPGGQMGFCDSCYPDNTFFYEIGQFPDHQHPDYQLWSHLSSPEMPTCRECPLMTLCGGACRYDAFKASKSLDGVDPLRCDFEKRFFHWMISELLPAGKNQGNDYYFPSPEDRRSLFGKVKLTEQNQPFTAGSLIG